MFKLFPPHINYLITYTVTIDDNQSNVLINNTEVHPEMKT